MLPEVLSNGLCSLNPQVDRLAMVCIVDLSKSGRMTGYRFCEAVIHSHARLTYNKVSQLLEHPDSPEAAQLRKQLPEVSPHLEELYRLCKVLLKARTQRGRPQEPGDQPGPAQRRAPADRGMHAVRQRGHRRLPAEARDSCPVPCA